MVFGPGKGGRRAGARPAPKLPERYGPRPTAVRLPAHRSPYGRHEVLDGGAVALVRPYLIEHERRQRRARQQRRRLTLVLAADFGIDLDAHVVGAGGAR
ncbi:hypothetical protein QCN29_32565 [Streptomyces sp. HNM0663]|uniref:Uncharacterized protein n=1 Tax=Streptomyces chengmaiensis TaxID=3040919 RepID=A0ABT6HXI7_9ACTN|nr:hypothetical protein [Streptomyces chengmaiensis]